MTPMHRPNSRAITVQTYWGHIPRSGESQKILVMLNLRQRDRGK